VYGSSSSPLVYGCYFSGGGGSAAQPQCYGGVTVNNVFHNADYGVNLLSFGNQSVGNTFIGKSSTTGTGLVSGGYMAVALNNVFERWDGSGAEAVIFNLNNSILINNKFYGNTADINTNTYAAVVSELNTTATSSLVEDIADENFAASSEAQSTGLPASKLIGTTDSGNGGTDLAINQGAAQNKAAGSGGGVRQVNIRGGADQ